MKSKGFKMTALMAAAGFCLPALAASSEEARNDTFIVPRTYMGETVMAAEPLNPSTVKDSWWSKVRATGSIQTQFLFAQNDPKIGTELPDGKVLNNTYFDLTINAPYISVGGRFEFMKWPLPGYENEFKGWGVPYIWATGRYKWASLTVGDYYEQFGSGLILRTYQERTLGVDNALRGARLKLNPAPGLFLTALGGKQRYYWEHNKSWIWGGDAEWSLNESFANAFSDNVGLTLGVSYVGKHENGKDQLVLTPDLKHQLHFPQNTAAFDGRVKLRLHDFDILAEFATKDNDPNSVNGYTYRRVHAELL